MERSLMLRSSGVQGVRGVQEGNELERISMLACRRAPFTELFPVFCTVPTKMSLLGSCSRFSAGVSYNELAPRERS
jgi:hypothetical protein